MNRLASPTQLRASFIRWSLFLVPAVLLLGTLSGLATGDVTEDPWFVSLDKPDIFPPPAAFGIVWPILYALMGFAMAVVCAAWGARFRMAAIVVFVIQLMLNLAWSPTFFVAHQITGSLAIIAALDLLVIITIILFWKVRRTAALLLLPYLAWILFATVLNYEFLRLNPDADGVQVSSAVERIEL